jgi:hypothetical protein
VQALRRLYRYWVAILFLAVLVQIGADHPVIGILHPVNALLVLGLIGFQAPGAKYAQSANRPRL